MAASVFDSPMFTRSFPTGEAARLFSDSASVRAVLLVQGTLAKAQGELGLVPEDSAFFIHRSAMEVQIDPAGLAEDIARDDLATAVRKAFHKAMEAPEHATFIQHGTIASEVEAAALSLRLRQFISHCEKRTAALNNVSCNQALAEARQASVGLFLTAEKPLANALAEALKLPLRDTPAESFPTAQAAATVTQELASAMPSSLRLKQLNDLAQGLLNALSKAPAAMTDICLAQICLAAASALEIADTDQ